MSSLSYKENLDVGLGLVVKLSLGQIKFNSFELDSEVGRLVKNKLGAGGSGDL